MTKLLSLDAKLSNIGYALFEDGVYSLSGQFAPTGKDWIDKIQSLSRWLYSWTMKHNITAIAYEIPTGSHGNTDTDRKLGALLYAVMLFCRLHNIEFVEVYPSQVKATSLYKVFNSKTKQVDLMRLNTINLYTGNKFALIYRHNQILNKAAMERQDDEIDSIGIALAAMEKMKND